MAGMFAVRRHRKFMHVLHSLLLLFLLVSLCAPASALDARAGSMRRGDVKNYAPVSANDLFYDVGRYGAKQFLGKRVFATFLYADNSMLDNKGPCGFLTPDKADWSLAGFFSGSKDSALRPYNRNMPIVLCFASQALYEKWGRGCPDNIWIGSPCHIGVAGIVMGPKPFKIRMGCCFRVYDCFFIVPERFKMLDRNSDIAMRQAKDVIATLTEVYSFTGKADSLRKMIPPP